MSTILKAENISKQYRLGLIGTGTLGDDLKRWWHLARGKEDPFLKVGAVNNRSSKAHADYVWALRDINFEVKQGEVLGIIGKNGAGKSTLLKLLSRVTSPTTGSIKTKGRIASLLEVGTGFHGELTGRENIFMNGAVLGMTKKEIKHKPEEIIDFSGCEMYIDTPVKRYSSGMTVRLGFAVAAHLEPEILVVDEVLAVGDAEFQKKAIGKMQDLSTGEGRTVLFVSHNMGSIQNLCTRTLLLENGLVVNDGEPESIIEEYLSKNNCGPYNTFFIPVDKEKDKRSFVTLKRFEITSKIKTGFPFLFEFKIKAERAITVDIAIGFKDSKESKVYQIFSEHSQKEIQLKRGSNVVKGKVESLPLVTGIYSLSLWIGSQFQEYDFYRESITIQVEEGGFIQGHLAPNRGFSVITKSNWYCNV